MHRKVHFILGNQMYVKQQECNLQIMDYTEKNRREMALIEVPSLAVMSARLCPGTSHFSDGRATMGFKHNPLTLPSDYLKGCACAPSFRFFV